jgi:hypothetical protein
MPNRIQMSRQRPWRHEHPDAVIVARPSALGNPFRVYRHCKGPNGDWGVEDTGRLGTPMGHGWTKVGATKHAVAAYARLIDEQYPPGSSARYALVASLAGRDLACWCPLDQPCHADVLIELANPDDRPGEVG